MKALIVALVLSLPVVATAQPPTRAHAHDYEPLAPALTAEQFANLPLFDLPGSNYSAGWDAIHSVPLRDGLLARFFYRRVDGLLVGVLEDYYGNVFTQTAAWWIGANLDQFDITRIAWASLPPLTPARLLTVTIFGYNRTTGLATRKLIAWAGPASYEDPPVPPTAR